MVILIIGITFVIEKIFFPPLNELLGNFTALLQQFLILLQDWRFYLITILVIVLLTLCLYAFAQKRALQREREERAHSLFWKRKDEEDERMRLLLSHTQINLEKQEVVPKIEEVSDEWEKPKVKISISVDLHKIFYKRKELNKHEIEYLIEEGYKEYSHKSIVTNKIEKYLLKPRFNESPTHLFVIYDIAEYLLSKDVDYGLFMTRMPDIVMNFDKKSVALEVETGTVMSNMKKFREKLQLLKENYGKDWHFIVTNRNKVKKYKKYGKVIDPRYIRGQLDKIIEKYRK